MDNDIENDTSYGIFSSDGSKIYHPKNTPSNFTIQFDKHIEFLRKMEVALAEIILPNNYADIKKQTINLMMRNEYKQSIKLQTLEISFNEIDTSEELYDSFINELQIKKTLIDRELNEIYDPEYKDILSGEIVPPILENNHNRLKQTKGSLNIRMTRRDNNEAILFPVELYWDFGKELNKIIGFGKFPENTRLITSKHHMKLPLTDTFYISTDIIVPSNFNNSKSNLLRIISRNKNFNKNNTYVFNPLIFVPVKKNLIESINITIKDDKDNYINFIGKKTIAILLFRPIEHI